MRTHGWSGAAPNDDEEAVERILTAAMEMMDERELVNILQISRRLGVTRQTVYRYFDSSGAILQAAAERSTSGFLRELSAAMDGVTDPADAVVEGIAVTLELLRSNQRFALLFGREESSRFLAEVTSPGAIALGRSIIGEFDVDWATAGWSDGDLDELVEHMLRMLQTLIADPGHPPRHGGDLRAYLRRWVAPSVAAPQRNPIPECSR
ncbi:MULTISPECIES: TetR/AcrR family transcriptional regulator [Gordonia]|jgi:AcrR family transcriptional regulator|uniref:TetR/AcrR family transcriptional regulator n=1 Tax=Gordonia TaxID=2053 RepID=UPI0032B4683B